MKGGGGLEGWRGERGEVSITLLLFSVTGPMKTDARRKHPGDKIR